MIKARKINTESVSLRYYNDISTLIISAVQTVFSSFTAPRGPLSPLGNAKGLAKTANYSAKMILQFNFAYQIGIFY